MPSVHRAEVEAGPALRVAGALLAVAMIWVAGSHVGRAQDTAVKPEPAKPAAASSNADAPDGPPMTMDQFLDRLMIAESGGRLDARNPRSTAVGPFQFIESTFLAVARRHFTAETAGLPPQKILALRTDMAFSRRAAEAYTHENAAVLQSFGVSPSYPNLRLAFLLGPSGAAKVLKAPPETPLAGLLSPAVLVANPFMAGMTALGLARRSAREVAQPVTTSQGVAVPPGTALPKRMLGPAIAVRCNLKLPSCKRWLSLQTAKLRTNRKGTKPTALASAAAKGIPLATTAPSRIGPASAKKSPQNR